MVSVRRSTALVVACVLGLSLPPAHADEPSGIQYFETHIRPVLVKQCYDCHSESLRARGGLRLDTKQGLLTGGSSGPTIVPNNPEDSLLISALKHEGLEMPPAGKLPDDVIAKFETWIKMGAPDPRDDKPAEVLGRREIDIEAGRRHWAYLPLKRSEAPEVSRPDWPATRIDRYLLAGMEQAKVAPVADAPSEVWLRRVAFVLTGLPPKVEDLAEIEVDASEGSRKRIVDRLLASPQFGERWARHWFDVARYAESTGKERNFPYHQAWRYRDYVIDSFNAGKPYDQFLREQIAGDLLPAGDDKARDEQQIATGFLALGPKGINERNRESFLLDIVDEQVDSLGRGLLATSIGCARCHDHKFDPIPTQDYYAVAGIFRSTETLAGVLNRQRFSGEASQLIALSSSTGGVGTSSVASELETLQRMEKEWESTRDEVRKLRQMNRQKARLAGAGPGDASSGTGAGEGATQVSGPGGQASGSPAPKTTSTEPASQQQVSADPSETDGSRLAIREKELADLERQITDKRDGVTEALVRTHALGVRDRSNPADIAIRVRGEVDKLGPVAVRGFPQVLSADWTPTLQSGSGRLQLADWIVDPRHPLTARVFVNRVWQKVFGEGLVPTVDDFGSQGQPPTHPELLDDLAGRFIEGGWSTKSLIREMVLSRAFALDYQPTAPAGAIDGENKLLWRWNRRRLEAEAIRDSLLAASGRLETARPVGTPAGHFGTREIRGQTDLSAIDRDYSVRSIYLPSLRNQLPQVLSLFDAPDQSLITGRRDETTSPPQALFFLNSETVGYQAVALATVLAEGQRTETQGIELGYQRVLGRRPGFGERSASSRFLAEFEAARLAAGATPEAARSDAWGAFARALFASPEFRYVF